MKSSNEVLTSSDGSNQTMPSTPNEDQSNWNATHIPTSNVSLSDMFTYIDKENEEISQNSLTNRLSEDQFVNLSSSKNNSPSISGISFLHNFPSSASNTTVLKDSMTTSGDIKILQDDFQNSNNLNFLDNFVIRVSQDFADESGSKNRYVLLNNPQILSNNQSAGTNIIESLTFNGENILLSANNNNIQIFQGNSGNNQIASIDGLSFANDSDFFKGNDTDFGDSNPSINFINNSSDAAIFSDSDTSILLNDNTNIHVLNKTNTTSMSSNVSNNLKIINSTSVNNNISFNKDLITSNNIAFESTSSQNQDSKSQQNVFLSQLSKTCNIQSKQMKPQTQTFQAQGLQQQASIITANNLPQKIVLPTGQKIHLLQQTPQNLQQTLNRVNTQLLQQQLNTTPIQVLQQINKLPQQVLRIPLNKTSENNILLTTQQIQQQNLQLLINQSQNRNLKQPSRSRNQTSKSSKTESGQTTKPGQAGSSNEKDSQELERVMNILKQYKQQIASNDHDSQFLPCKRKRSKPSESLSNTNHPNSSSISIPSNIVNATINPNIIFNFNSNTVANSLATANVSNAILDTSLVHNNINDASYVSDGNQVNILSGNNQLGNLAASTSSNYKLPFHNISVTNNSTSSVNILNLDKKIINLNVKTSNGSFISLSDLNAATQKNKNNDTSDSDDNEDDDNEDVIFDEESENKLDILQNYMSKHRSDNIPMQTNFPFDSKDVSTCQKQKSTANSSVVDALKRMLPLKAASNVENSSQEVVQQNNKQLKGFQQILIHALLNKTASKTLPVTNIILQPTTAGKNLENNDLSSTFILTTTASSMASAHKDGGDNKTFESLNNVILTAITKNNDNEVFNNSGDLLNSMSTKSNKNIRKLNSVLHDMFTGSDFNYTLNQYFKIKQNFNDSSNFLQRPKYLDHINQKFAKLNQKLSENNEFKQLLDNSYYNNNNFINDNFENLFLDDFANVQNKLETPIEISREADDANSLPNLIKDIDESADNLLKNTPRNTFDKNSLKIINKNVSTTLKNTHPEDAMKLRHDSTIKTAHQVNTGVKTNQSTTNDTNQVDPIETNIFNNNKNSINLLSINKNMGKNELKSLTGTRLANNRFLNALCRNQDLLSQSPIKNNADYSNNKNDDECKFSTSISDTYGNEFYNESMHDTYNTCDYTRPMGMLLKRWNDPEEIKEWLVDSFQLEMSEIVVERIELNQRRSASQSFDFSSKQVLQRKSKDEKVLCLVTSTTNSSLNFYQQPSPIPAYIWIVGLVFWDGMMDGAIDERANCFFRMHPVDNDKKRRYRGSRVYKPTLTSSVWLHKDGSYQLQNNNNNTDNTNNNNNNNLITNNKSPNQKSIPVVYNENDNKNKNNNKNINVSNSGIAGGSSNVYSLYRSDLIVQTCEVINQMAEKLNVFCGHFENNTSLPNKEIEPKTLNNWFKVTTLANNYDGKSAGADDDDSWDVQCFVTLARQPTPASQEACKTKGLERQVGIWRAFPACVLYKLYDEDKQIQFQGTSTRTRNKGNKVENKCSNTYLLNSNNLENVCKFSNKDCIVVSTPKAIVTFNNNKLNSNANFSSLNENNFIAIDDAKNIQNVIDTNNYGGLSLASFEMPGTSLHFSPATTASSTYLSPVLPTSSTILLSPSMPSSSSLKNLFSTQNLPANFLASSIHGGLFGDGSNDLSINSLNSDLINTIANSDKDNLANESTSAETKKEENKNNAVTDNKNDDSLAISSVSVDDIVSENLERVAIIFENDSRGMGEDWLKMNSHMKRRKLERDVEICKMAKLDGDSGHYETNLKTDDTAYNYPNNHYVAVFSQHNRLLPTSVYASINSSIMNSYSAINDGDLIPVVTSVVDASLKAPSPIDPAKDKVVVNTTHNNPSTVAITNTPIENKGKDKEIKTNEIKSTAISQEPLKQNQSKDSKSPLKTAETSCAQSSVSQPRSSSHQDSPLSTPHKATTLQSTTQSPQQSSSKSQASNKTQTSQKTQLQHHYSVRSRRQKTQRQLEHEQTEMEGRMLRNMRTRHQKKLQEATNLNASKSSSSNVVVSNASIVTTGATSCNRSSARINQSAVSHTFPTTTGVAYTSKKSVNHTNVTNITTKSTKNTVLTIANSVYFPSSSKSLKSTASNISPLSINLVDVDNTSPSASRNAKNPTYSTMKLRDRSTSATVSATNITAQQHPNYYKNIESGVFLQLIHGSVYFEVKNSCIQTSPITNHSGNQICLKFSHKKSEVVPTQTTTAPPNHSIKSTSPPSPTTVLSSLSSISLSSTFFPPSLFSSPELQLVMKLYKNKLKDNKIINTSPDLNNFSTTHKNEHVDVDLISKLISYNDIFSKDEDKPCIETFSSAKNDKTNPKSIDVALSDTTNTTEDECNLATSSTMEVMKACSQLFSTAEDHAAVDTEESIKNSDKENEDNTDKNNADDSNMPKFNIEDAPHNLATTPHKSSLQNSRVVAKKTTITMTTNTLVTKWISPKVAATGPYQTWW